MTKHIIPPFLHKTKKLIPIFMPPGLIFITCILFIIYWFAALVLSKIIMASLNYDPPKWIWLTLTAIIAIVIRYVSNKMMPDIIE